MTTRESVESSLKGHALPYLGPRPLGSFKPEHIRDWLSKLMSAVPASSYRRVILAAFARSSSGFATS
ncbi:hypothetical protein ACIA8J_05165 [Streptomyces asoensis]|uniref:hypothetical protein n=1 Tax=Streptomyces asoensis TaxID=249586 RepID=UPI0037A472C6